MKTSKAIFRPTVWLAAAALILFVFLAHAFAAPNVTYEAESGTRSGQVQMVGGAANASDNAYLSFTAANNEQTGVWQNVTPANMPLSGGNCDSYGVISMELDPKRPSDLYTMADCAGVWKSTDYGKTWNGPLNTGTNGTASKSCAGGIAIGAGSGSNPPTIYQDCIRGNIDFWRSTDGGVNWTTHNLAMTENGGRHDYYPPAVDPYDPLHVLIGGHEFASVLETIDGGTNWRSVPLNSTQLSGGGSSYLYFVDTGNATTTRNTWLYAPQNTGNNVGMWRTTNSGASWTKVSTAERGHGASQAWQIPGTGTFLMGGQGSGGNGIYRSTDYGVTWARVGADSIAEMVVGTPNRLYVGESYFCGGCNGFTDIQTAPTPGATGWSFMPRASGMNTGAGAGASTFDGTHHIVITANWRNGIWRYVEP